MSDVTATLGTRPGWLARAGRWLLAAILALAALLALGLWRGGDNGAAARYVTRPVQRGDLRVSVTATGTLQPTNQVDVGSELSGILRSVEVDYNDRVRVGQVLARLDTAKLQSQVTKSAAALDSARAKVLQAQATVREARSELARLTRMQGRGPGRVTSESEIEAAQAALDRAQAEEAGATATVAEAQATLEANQTDLGKAAILSPIDGVVLVRAAEPGQTVAASLQAPVLFTLAEDLTQMELHVDVDEADVGQVREGQAATFSVDAYPDQMFPARVTQVRFGARTVSGVVSYETLLGVENADLALRPGMTATADIVVRQVAGALLVPSAALRFSPPAREASPGGAAPNLLGRLMPRPPRTPPKARGPAEGPGATPRVYVLRDGEPVTVPVTTGASSGPLTEIRAGDLQPGTEVVVEALPAGSR